MGLDSELSFQSFLFRASLQGVVSELSFQSFFSALHFRTLHVQDCSGWGRGLVQSGREIRLAGSGEIGLGASHDMLIEDIE